MKLVENRSPKRNTALSSPEKVIAGTVAPSLVRECLPAFPAYEPTPLEGLPNLAASLRLAGIDIKNEGPRYGLGSFKALGGAYAVARLVNEHAAAVLGRRVAPAELLGEEIRKTAAQLTVCCAADGNHGRSVAAGAEMFGCRCVIFLHRGVSAGREKAIAGFGAEIRRTNGNYDQSVAEAREVGAREGWTVVSDFASEGYTAIPGLVMQGYTLILEEISRQSKQPYTHIFVQGGVGGLAAVVAGYFLDRDGAARPKLIVVEPEQANCLQASAAAGSPYCDPSTRSHDHGDA
jgi:diaminopropionate ammonia-lyase